MYARAAYATARVRCSNEQRWTHARCASLLVCAWLQSRTTRSCAPYIGALPASVPASVFLLSLSHETLPVLVFAPLRLSAPLRLCDSVLLSSLCAALLFCSASRIYFCSASRLAVSASPLLHSTLLLHSLVVRDSSIITHQHRL